MANLLAEVVLKYFTNALGSALTPEAATGWTNFLDLMIEVVKETARGQILFISTLYKEFQKTKHIRKQLFPMMVTRTRLVGDSSISCSRLPLGA